MSDAADRLAQAVRDLINEAVQAAVGRQPPPPPPPPKPPPPAPKPPPISDPRPRLLTVAEVMARLSLGRSKVFQLIASGQLRSVKVGSRRLVSEASLAEYIDHLDADG